MIFFPAFGAPTSVGSCAQEFYEVSNKHRKLTWIYALGTCTLACHFDARTIDLSVTTFQAAVLLLFNDGACCPAVHHQLMLLCQGNTSRQGV